MLPRVNTAMNTWLKVLVGEGDGSKTRESDNKYIISISKGREKPLTYVYGQDRNNPLLLVEKR